MKRILAGTPRLWEVVYFLRAPGAAEWRAEVVTLPAYTRADLERFVRRTIPGATIGRIRSTVPQSAPDRGTVDCITRGEESTSPDSTKVLVTGCRRSLSMVGALSQRRYC